MGRITGTFYKVYGMAKRIESIVLTNLMFETIGSTTYRLALRRATHPSVRQMLTILTRDESFHVPLNVHFLRETLKRTRARESAHERASRRRAEKFDKIPFKELSTAYAEQLGRLFLHESDLDLTPPKGLLRLFGLDREELARGGDVSDVSAVSVEAAEAAVERDRVVVTAL
jgi:hypothetical protein